MKVLHIVSHDIGGAAKAAMRLNDALNLNNTDSNLLTTFYNNKEKKINSIINDNFINKIKYKILRRLNRCIIKLEKTKEYFSCDFFAFPILKNKYIKNADIIHLHWINDCIINYKTLNKLALLNKKVVWTMHDMNPFTGGCHYSNNCDNYKLECMNCPYAKGKWTHKVWKNKIKAISNLNITVIGCSKWITECAKKSSIFKNKRCVNIPNCVDTNKFMMIDRKIAREKLGIKENKKIVLFGAMSSTSDKRKGFIQLKDALNLLPKDEYQCYVFGSNEIPKFEIDINIKSLGFIRDEEILNLAYNSADVFVAPSLQENLANTVLESISCGTPVVAFDIGGMSDMIYTGKTGYLAEYKNSKDLAMRIIECANKSIDMRDTCRNLVKEKYSYEVISNRFYELYKEILGGEN